MIRLLPMVLALGLGLPAAGCTAVLDFADCAVDADCERFAEGLVCSEQRCVSAVGPGPAVIYGDLLGGQCATLFGVDSTEAIREDVVVIGSLLPTTGALGSVGKTIEQAVQLAVIEINQAGGILGRELAVVACDTATDPEIAREAGIHLADVAKVPAIVGAAASSSTTEVFTKVAQGHGILMISPSSTAASITNLPDGGLLWRTVPSDAAQGLAITSYLVASGYRRVGVVNRDDTYGNGLSQVIQENLCLGDSAFDCDKDARFFVYGDETQGDDHAKAILELVPLDPEAIVLIAFEEDGIDFMNAASAEGLGPFVLTDGLRSTKLLEELPIALQCSLVGTAPADPDGQEFLEFGLRYKNRFGTDPGVFNANAYDAVYLLGYAVAGALGKGEEVTGTVLASELRRLSSGNTVEAGNSAWGATVDKLFNNQTATVDYIGASGALDMDPETGEPSKANIEGWFIDLASDPPEIGTLGTIFQDDGTYIDPEFDPSCGGG